MLAMAAYHVIYDATSATSPVWPLVALCAVVGAIGAVLSRGQARSGFWSRTMRVCANVLLIFGPLAAALLIVGPYAQLVRMRASLATHEVERIEGIVFDQPPGARAVDAPPSWVVEENVGHGTTRAHWYTYEHSRLAIGYVRSGPNMGGIRSGSRVRIAEVRGRIAKLEAED